MVKECAVTILDGKAYYQLDAERVGIILSARHGNKRFDIGVTLKPYASGRLVDLLRQREVYFTPAKDEPGATNIERGSIDLDRSFFDEHMIGVTFNGGHPLNAEEIERLDARYAIKVNAVNAGLNGVNTEVDEEAKITLEEIFSDATAINQYMHFVGPDGKECRVDVTHRFRAPTAADSLEYGRTSKVRTMEGGGQRLSVNYKARLKLYDSMIESLDGFLVGDAVCSAANKAAWLERVPAFFKLAALDHLFRGSSRKNG